MKTRTVRLLILELMSDNLVKQEKAEGQEKLELMKKFSKYSEFLDFLYAVDGKTKEEARKMPLFFEKLEN